MAICTVMMVLQHLLCSGQSYCTQQQQQQQQQQQHARASRLHLFSAELLAFGYATRSLHRPIPHLQASTAHDAAAGIV